MFMPGFEFYEVKKKNFVIIFQKEKGNTFKCLPTRVGVQGVKSLGSNFAFLCRGV